MRIHSPAITGALTLSGSIVIGYQQANPKSLSIVESVSGNFDAIFLGNSRTSANDNVVINMSPASLASAKIVADAPGASDVNLEFHTINGGGAGGIFTMKGDNVFSGSATSTGSFSRGHFHII